MDPVSSNSVRLEEINAIPVSCVRMPFDPIRPYPLSDPIKHIVIMHHVTALQPYSNHQEDSSARLGLYCHKNIHWLQAIAKLN